MRTTRCTVSLTVMYRHTGDQMSQDDERILHDKILDALRRSTNPNREDVGIVQVISPYGVAVRDESTQAPV